MKAGDVFALNGDFRESPLIETCKRLHSVFTPLDIPYAIVGGMAAKDLSDVVALTRSNMSRVTPEFIRGMHPGVRQDFIKIRDNIEKSAGA